MQYYPTQLSDVSYNAATQSFEARVTVHDPAGARSYACAIDAPITMEFEQAARGLATQAMRRHRLADTTLPATDALPPYRAGRPRSGFGDGSPRFPQARIRAA